MQNMTQDTLDALKSIQSGNQLQKTWLQSTGLVAYDLEPGAKLEYPVLTPLRNMLPRVKSNNGDTATRWKQITAINTNKVKPGVSEGNRGGKINTTVTSSLAAYAGLGLEDDVTFEADYAAQSYDDAKARAVQGLLNAVFIEEEKVLLDGNATTSVSAPGQPSTTASTSGGTLATATYNVYCVALTGDGYRRSSVSGGVVTVIARTNADGTSDNIGGGSSNKSTVASQAVTGPTGSISASVAAVKGAMAYAWFWGTAGSELLGAITTINSVLITATATGTQNASAITADNTKDALVFDGLITQALNGQGYYFSMPTGTAGTGTGLTVNNAGGIVEIENALKSFWDNYKVWPSVIWVSSQELVNITNKVLANGGSSTIRFVVDQGSNLASITAGSVIGFYINKFAGGGGALIPIRLHPNLTPGTIYFHADSLPYPVNGISNLAQVKCRQDYYQIEWPLTTRKWPYGVYVDEVLQVYATFPFGVISNIANA